MLIKSKQVHKYYRLFGVFASTYVVTTISQENVDSFKRIQLVLSFVHIPMNLLCWIKLIGSTILQIMCKNHYFSNSILDVIEGRLVQGQNQVALVTVEGLIHKPSLFGCATFFHA